MRLTALICVAGLVQGCGRALARAADSAAASSAAQQASIGDPKGGWTVVADTAPGISAMEVAKRRAWRGRVAQYGPDLATFATDTCRTPAYASRAVDADSLFDIGFLMVPQDLGFPPHGRVTVTDVTCGGKAWTAPGAILIWVSPTRAFTAWDGVFFLLSRGG